MNAIEPLVDEAREHLITRAKREGLVTVGYDVMDSPLGPLWIAVGPRGVLAIHYGAKPDPRDLARISRTYGPAVLPDRRSCDRVLTELDQYFAHRRRSFDLDIDLTPLTPFQRRVLAATALVPYGELTTYRQVAPRAGNDQASRPAGGARGPKPIPRRRRGLSGSTDAGAAEGVRGHLQVVRDQRRQDHGRRRRAAADADGDDDPQDDRQDDRPGRTVHRGQGVRRRLFDLRAAEQ